MQPNNPTGNSQPDGQAGDELAKLLLEAFNAAWVETQPVGRWVARDYNADFPLTLPRTTVAIRDYAERLATQRAVEARGSEQNRIFAILRYLGVKHDAKAIMKLRREWEIAATLTKEDKTDE